MTTLPPNFNFPGAQQGIPQGIFSLVQSMAGMGPGGMAQQQAPFNTNFSNTLAQLMQPTAAGPQQQIPNTLPPMPVVPKAPIVESRVPKDPVTPLEGGAGASEEMQKYLDLLHANLGGGSNAQRSNANALLRNPPADMEWKTNKTDSGKMSRSLVSSKTKPSAKTGGNK